MGSGTIFREFLGKKLSDLLKVLPWCGKRKSVYCDRSFVIDSARQRVILHSDVSLRREKACPVEVNSPDIFLIHESWSVIRSIATKGDFTNFKENSGVKAYIYVCVCM